MLLFEATGGVRQWNPVQSDLYKYITADAWTDNLHESLEVDNVVIVEFQSTADGRGFSIARSLRDTGFRGGLVATGALIPDQLSMALSCGFDGVAVSTSRVDRHGQTEWETALRSSANIGYSVPGANRALTIWQARSQLSDSAHEKWTDSTVALMP